MHIDDRELNLTVSVIIPTLNAGPDLQVLLERIWKQTLSPAEIIVVDSSSNDGTPNLARKLGAKVYSIDQADYDHGGTRNFAASHATGEILVFMTQDAVPKDNYMLYHLVTPLAEQNIAYSYARQIAKPESGLLEQLSRSYNYPPNSVRKNLEDIPLLGMKTFFSSNVCSAVSRKLFKELGQFPAPVIFNEDMFFAAKCMMSGYVVSYTAQAIVLHSHNYTLREQFKRFFDNGVSIRMNEWITSFSSENRIGLEQLHYQFKAIIERWALKYIPIVFAEAFAKYIGFKLGKNYHRLPNFLLTRFSMHVKIIRKLHNTNIKEMK